MATTMRALIGTSAGWIVQVAAATTVVIGLVAQAGDERYVRQDQLQRATAQVTRVIRCDAVLAEIARLEQTILYLESQNLPSGLQDVELKAAERRLAQLGGCAEQPDG